MKWRALATCKGVSLIEIIVGVVILTVMAILLSHTYMSAVRVSERSVCTSNLREVGQAILLYATNNDGWLPGPTPTVQTAKYNAGNVKSPMSVVSFLVPYMGLSLNGGVAQSFICPAAVRQVVAQGGTADNVASYASVATRLDEGKLIRPLGYRASGATTTQNAKLTHIERPDLVRTMIDLDGVGIPGAISRVDVADIPAHGETWNFLYLDGHVESVPVEH